MSSLKQTLALLSWLFLAGCSRHSTSERLAVDPSISACAPLKALQLPSGLTVPSEDKRYQIPPKPVSSLVASPLDIRPPIQPLALLPGSEAYYQGKQAILQLEQTTDTPLLWQRLKQWLVQAGITTITQDDRHSVLVTDWITADTLDEKKEYSARYRLSLTSKTPATLISELIALKRPLEHLPQDQKQKTNPAALSQERTPTASEQRHYAILMLNRLITDLAKPTTAAETPVQVTPSPKS